MTTDQERYWKDNDAYHARSPGNEESNYHFFRKALACADLRWNCSILEFGCGTGANLRALKRCYSSPVLTGVEINQKVAESLYKDPNFDIYVGSVLDPFQMRDQQDLVITKGLLIHVAPADLPKAYKTIVDATSRYLLVCEYFCPTRRMIPYRGQNDRLWAADFAGELMNSQAFRDGLKLVDYGFVSRRDMHPQDNLTFWLLEKP